MRHTVKYLSVIFKKEKKKERPKLPETGRHLKEKRKTTTLFMRREAIEITLTFSSLLWIFFPPSSLALFFSQQQTLSHSLSASQSRCLLPEPLTSATRCSASSIQSQLEFLLTSPCRTTIGEMAGSSSQSACRVVKSSRMLPPAGRCGRGPAYSFNPTACLTNSRLLAS